jgi:hypothetical protein
MLSRPPAGACANVTPSRMKLDIAETITRLFMTHLFVQQARNPRAAMRHSAAFTGPQIPPARSSFSLFHNKSRESRGDQEQS